MSRLPDNYLEARKLAAPRAVLRLVPYDEPADRLPDDPDALVGPSTSPLGVVVRAVVLVAVSVGFVWLVTVGAWDDENFFPWFWNVLWTLFPWFFLTPLWVMFFKSLLRKPGNDRFRHAYRQERYQVSPVAGTVVDTRVSRSDTGGVAGFVVKVRAPGGGLVVGRLAPGRSPAAHELPQPPATVYLWRFSDDWTIVQAGQGRVDTPTGPPAVPERRSTAEELAQLAELHRSGALTQAEFEAAKRRVLEP